MATYKTARVKPQSKQDLSETDKVITTQRAGSFVKNSRSANVVSTSVNGSRVVCGFEFPESVLRIKLTDLFTSQYLLRALASFNCRTVGDLPKNLAELKVENSIKNSIHEKLAALAGDDINEEE